ncbi:MAG TPA: dTDP-4-dehydrorhamnose reductase [Casimicrobiaceae bacterium]|nr:dTDP-4-dehydrorhamnose reductase [Casimicrobiaceae bacterium]
MTHPTILVTGARGQIGEELARLLPAHGEVVALDRSQLDLADPDGIRSTLRSLRPQIVVNAAAYTAVDRAEREHASAFAVNAQAPGILAEEAKRLDAVLVHFSTDYVFDGGASQPYAEDAPTAPLGVYGASKLAGEQAIEASGCVHLSFRTSWIYALRGHNFLLTIRRLARERDELTVVADQLGVPNWAHSVAEAVTRLVGRGAPYLAERRGLYHLSGTGVASWFDFARAILGPVEHPRLSAITTAQYPTAARRPAYAVLSAAKFETAFGFGLPDWRAMLSECLATRA